MHRRFAIRFYQVYYKLT